jgi:hypothetical protein
MTPIKKAPIGNDIRPAKRIVVARLNFAMADCTPGLEIFADRSKRCAIVYIGIAAPGYRNKCVLSKV